MTNEKIMVRLMVREIWYFRCISHQVSYIH